VQTMNRLVQAIAQQQEGVAAPLRNQLAEQSAPPPSVAEPQPTAPRTADYSGRTVYAPADVTERPRPLSRPTPNYPASLRRQRLEGDVVLEFVVNQQGRVQDIQVLSATHEAFAAPALDAIRGMRFSPGTLDGRAVPVRLRVSVPFRFE
jgi:periplasmic protein TonB